MNPRMYKATVLLVVAAVLVVAIAWRLQRRPSAAAPPPSVEAPEAAAASQPAADAKPGPSPSASSAKPTPKYPAVIDLGMGKCIPCKQMKPILDELKQEYQGRCRIEIIDIGERPEQADRYRVNLIPTQVFLDKDGEEVFRHEGFMPKADIVAKLNEMGVE